MFGEHRFKGTKYTLAKILDGKKDELKYTQIEILAEKCSRNRVKLKILYKDEAGETLMYLPLPYLDEGCTMTIVNGFDVGLKILWD